MKKLWAIFIILFLTTSISCGGKYNTDFPPPDPNKGSSQSFPAKIGNETFQQSSLNLPKPDIGFQATYGNGKMIVQIIQSPNKDQANIYFKNKVVPIFDAMPNHSRAQVNGRWYASGKGKDGRVWHGWVQHNWSFVINADNQENFDLMVKALPYIEKK